MQLKLSIILLIILLLYPTKFKDAMFSPDFIHIHSQVSDPVLIIAYKKGQNNSFSMITGMANFNNSINN